MSKYLGDEEESKQSKIGRNLLFKLMLMTRFEALLTADVRSSFQYTIGSLEDSSLACLTSQLF